MADDSKIYRDLGGRRPGLRMLGATVPKLTDKVLRKRGFVESALIHRWSSIVGEEIAGWCSPDRVAFPRDRRVGATLHLLVPGARALELQHLEPVLLERINTVFGYDALERISIRQGQLPETTRKTRPTPRPLESKEESWITEQVAEFQDQDLKNALQALGRAVLSRK
ncbi:MAG: DciA family protein [Alphaproteobacteria bacterium]|nr:DciA family protein [Alphaproteobacteria bacterium]